MARAFWRLGGAAVTLGAMGIGCSAGTAPIDDDENGAGGNGQGAAGGGGDDAGGGMTSPCGTDCSQTTTPDCFISVCNEGEYPGQLHTCVVIPGPAGDPCDDEQFCTVNDTCNGEGVCKGGAQNDCGMQPGECQEITCNEASKSCASQNIAAGGACTATDLCTVGATCNAAGQCQGSPKDCFFAPVPNECHTATCNPQNGVCEPQPGNDGQGCIDTSDLCSVNNTCSGGVCSGGTPKDCSALSGGCNNGVCNPLNGQCEPQPIAPGATCLEATNDCNQGICDMGGVCVPNPINQDGACDDGLSCTTATTCNNGTCGGGTSTITTYLVESFASNASGWTLDTSWQIGPAVHYPALSCGNGDPGTDHTASTSDNGIAGAVIGGHIGIALTNGYRYLTSPVINTSSAPTLWLQYWRFLNSDYTPYMNNTVEVYDGSSWQLVWQSGPFPPVLDSEWMYMSHDITAYKNSQLQIRFGYAIEANFAFHYCGGWNLDDVLIATGTCN